MAAFPTGRMYTKTEKRCIFEPFEVQTKTTKIMKVKNGIFNLYLLRFFSQYVLFAYNKY